MKNSKIITLIWLTLISLTLLSILIAENTPTHMLSITFVCLVIAIKGQLVIDKLIGLRFANPKIRWVMLSYFYILPPIIILSLAFPELLYDITSQSNN